ncbi:hypothetical protein IQ241_13990 [Romeria aff. gracilis LEGE 07310]|uniref:Uncharacterized protein n=1 Tax=Vasconcelosia minhoensis LEGE 07310 TaxID=915328 RepID=A0A8J7A7J7_9CYAN|nr:hypothetical protein [Romeria gracilis]MBE9078392.1 hypothetical protein [Romeria aff. gracilis LEGE 07310]
MNSPHSYLPDSYSPGSQPLSSSSAYRPARLGQGFQVLWRGFSRFMADDRQPLYPLSQLTHQQLCYLRARRIYYFLPLDQQRAWLEKIYHQS